MSILSMNSSIEQYSQYAASTLRLNQALNTQLNTCYTRINQLTNQLTLLESTNYKLLQQSNTLKNRLQQIQAEGKASRQRTDISQRISPSENIKIQPNGFYVENWSSSRSKYPQSRLVAPETKQMSIQTQQQYSNQRQNELEQIQKLRHNMQKIAQQNMLVKQDLICCEQDIMRLNQKNKQYQNQIILIQQQLAHKQIQLSEYKTQFNQLTISLLNKQTIIHRLNERVIQQQNHILSNQHLITQIETLTQIISNYQQKASDFINLDRIKESNIQLIRRIKQLQEYVSILQSQNMVIKNNNKHQEIKQSKEKSKEIKRQNSFQIEIKDMKEQIKSLIKQNMGFVQHNSKLQKNRMEMIRELESCRKELEEAREKNIILIQQNTETAKQLHQKNCQLIEINQKMKLKENQAKNLKTMAQKEIISQLDGSMRNFQSIKGALGRLTNKNESCESKDQIPVRDVSRGVKLPKSRSSVMMFAGIK